MNSLYKRIITLGMVSVTALLAWIYCIVTFPKQLVYLAAISLVVVVSLYALLNALTGLRIEKENKLQAYFRQVTNEVVEKALEAGDSEEAIRLAKASYVQIRRSSTSLKSLLELSEQNAAVAKAQHDESCTLIADSINKATKIVVKYSGNNNNKLLDGIETLSAQVAELKLEMISMDENGDVPESVDYTEILTDIMGKLDTLKINVTQEVSGMSVPVGNAIAAARQDFLETEAEYDDEDYDTEEYDADLDEDSDEPADFDDFEDSDEIEDEIEIEAVSVGAEVAEPEMAEAEIGTAAEAEKNSDSDLDDDIAGGMALAQGMIDALLAGTGNTNQAPTAPVEDPGKKLSADEIAALFAASKEERKAESDDDFKVEDHPDAMDQSLIDALLGLDLNEEDEASNAAKLADVIPFPNITENVSAPAAPEPETEKASAPVAPESVAPAAEDPNKKLSADEIAALFAANSAPVATPEPEVEKASAPVAPELVAQAAEDPNKKLSADEIAALFAANSAPAATPEPETEKASAPVVAEKAPEPVAPAAEDPNKKLSADEIAALFAANSAPVATPEPEVEKAPEPAVPESVAEKAPEPVAPAAEDPNKKLSADEIAALFAANSVPVAAPEPVVEKKTEPIVAAIPAAEDPNKKLSPDEIAALFSSMSG